jgi:arsenite-transporting ATPase
MRLLLFAGCNAPLTAVVAAATALDCAAGDRRVLLLSGAGGSAADVLDVAVGPDPTAVPLEAGWALGTLVAQEVDVFHERARRLGATQRWLRELLPALGAPPPADDDPALLPGAEELALLLCLWDHARTGAYDVLVVDPGAAVARLFVLPDLIRRWDGRVSRRRGGPGELARLLLARLAGLPLPDAAAAAELRALLDGALEAAALLADADVTSARLVADRDRVAVAATRRLATALALAGVAIDLVVARGAPERAFAPLSVRELSLTDADLSGAAPLLALARGLYGDGDPAGWFARVAAGVTAEGGAPVLRLPLPFVRVEDLAVTQTGDEMAVRAGGVQRTWLLPASLRGRTCTGARYAEGVLVLSFAAS